MLSKGTPLHSAGIICSWLAANYGNNAITEPHVLLFLEMDEFLSFPESVQAYGENREQRHPTAPARIGVPAGILAKHAIGQTIPEKEKEEEY